jgi:hypothetical protein
MEDAHRLGIIATNDCENLFIDLIKSVNKTEENTGGVCNDENWFVDKRW